MKVGVNGAVRDISDFKAGVNGAVHAVSELWIGVNGAVKKVWPIIPVGYQEILDTVGSGEWTCPASGSWQVECHGGGGGAGGASYQYYGAGGGGSGELFTENFTAGVQVNYSVGAGGEGGTGPSNGPVTAGSKGGATSFGSHSLSGGGGGGAGQTSLPSAGIGHGSLATSGYGGGRSVGHGGYGNKNNQSQTYGNGGRSVSRGENGGSGEDGAIILTYLG